MNDAANDAAASRVERILVVDDHDIVREGLRAILERDTHLRVVASAATGQEAIQTTQRLRPDVIIMDLMMPDLNGIEATKSILSSDPLMRVIALSAHRTPEHVHRALRAGARGYVVKSAVGAELIQAVKAVAAGRRYVSPGIMPKFVDSGLAAPLPKSSYERLSGREREVLRRIVAGASSVEIAQHLCLSRKTVDTYRGRLMVKLGVANRSALIRLAIEHELTAA